MKILITGGTNGMGKGVAKRLAQIDNQTHEVIILSRSREHCEVVAKELEDATLNKKISIVPCDLTKLSDVKVAIKEIYDKHGYLDGVFINAGLGYAAKRVETEDGMDPHFQVNYLSQFMLVLNLLDLLEKSESGGRIVFNVTEAGKINWDDLQMKSGWGYVKAIQQAMVAKRMFLAKLHRLCRKRQGSKLSFIGFQIHKTVWSNQVNIIPAYMKAMASMAKFFGGFISIDECGSIMAPLFTEPQSESLKKSGKFITWKSDAFVEIKEDKDVLDPKTQDRLWKTSLNLCADENTTVISNTYNVGPLSSTS